MEAINGWTLDRNGRGFWLVAGTVRDGPFATPDRARAYARLIPAPKPKPVVKIRRKVDDGKPA